MSTTLTPPESQPPVRSAGRRHAANGNGRAKAVPAVACASSWAHEQVRSLPAVQKLIADGLQRGYLTPEEMTRALPADLGAEQVEEVRAFVC